MAAGSAFSCAGALAGGFLAELGLDRFWASTAVAINNTPQLVNARVRKGKRVMNFSGVYY
jgi:hypothetical protein